MVKLSFEMIQEALALISSMDHDKLIRQVFPAWTEEAKRDNISLMKDMGFTRFINEILTPHHLKNFDSLLSEKYYELSTPYAVTVSAWHDQHSVEAHLKALGMSNGDKILTPNELDNAIINLNNHCLNYQLIWSKPGNRGILFLDNKNFKQR